MAPLTSAFSVLDQVNRARAAAGLPAYTISPALTLSATRHTLLMAGGCGLHHQCPGETSLGTRITAAGMTWSAVGENVGDGGPVSDTTAAATAMAEKLIRIMLAELPPDDGHRMNILSVTFRHIGICVYRNGSGVVWLTQDFSN
jgi:uncharacterized protein YkwD